MGGRRKPEKCCAEKVCTEYMDGDDEGVNLNIGESCSVRIREGTKMAAYVAKLLGIGKHSVPYSESIDFFQIKAYS